MKVLRSGIEVDPEELEKNPMKYWRPPACCSMLPTGCSGQPGGGTDFHYLESNDQEDTRENHQD